MGVRGLATFISQNSFLKPYELCNTYVVVDGNNVASYLYRTLSKSHSAFGGDYDEYYKTVHEFFSMLIKCGVTPIVLFDGGVEKKKLKTKLSRTLSYLYNLKSFAKGFSPSKFSPIFMKQTFIDVMVDMNIICAQCDFEADMEVATIARALNCPVLSYDSDFFIVDVLYIPLPTVHEKPVQYPGSKQLYVRCSIFDRSGFLKTFSGLDMHLLPIMATLLGNDFNDSSLFEKFFGHVRMPKSKKLTDSQRKIHGVLNWLRKETVESATKLILSHLGNKSVTKASKAFESNIQDYSNDFISEAVLEKLVNQLGDIKLKKKNFDTKIPSEIVQLYSQCKIDKLIIDIVYLGIYFTYVQLENIYCQSSHFPALPLIRCLYTLLLPYMEKPTPLRLYMSVGIRYEFQQLNKDPNSFLNHVKLGDILKESEKERVKWLCSILGVDDEHLNLLSADYWSIFLMAFIYWTKQLHNLITSDHVHALIIMVIGNQVVQKFVGYYRTYSKFEASKGAQLNELKETNLETGNPATFNEMLECVTLYEKLFIHSVLLPYRQTTEEGTGKAYDISIIHLFSCFQSCLFHVMQLNALLNYPFPHLKVKDFYSGTLLFNLYINIKRKNFLQNLFKGTPNLARIHTYLYTSLCKFLNNATPEVKKNQKKKRNKRGKK